MTGGAESIESTIGPMGRSMASITDMFKLMLAQEPWLLDPKVIEMPWQQNLFDLKAKGNTLCFGILKCDGVITPHPPVQRALRMVEEALVKAGHIGSHFDKFIRGRRDDFM